jgi:hypothetical protein
MFGEIVQIILGLGAILMTAFCIRLDKKEKHRQTIDYAKAIAKSEKLEADKNAAIETKKTREEIESLSDDELLKRVLDRNKR